METDNTDLRNSLFLRGLNILAGTYFLLTSVMFILVIVYSGWLSDLVAHYEFKWVRNPMPVILVASVHLLLNGSAFTGILLMHKGNSHGIQFFVISTGILLISHLFLRQPDWFSFGWLSILLFLYILSYRYNIPLGNKG